MSENEENLKRVEEGARAAFAMIGCRMRVGRKRGRDEASEARCSSGWFYSHGPFAVGYMRPFNHVFVWWFISDGTEVVDI